MLTLDIQAKVGALSLSVQLPAYDGTTVVVGQNGAGKSTLLKCLLGALKPERGAITLEGRTLYDSDARVDLPIEYRRLGYVPQRYGLFPHMTVAQNVGFGIHWRSRKEREAKVAELLEDLGISHLAERKAPALSGGESQRVALARALAIGPRALLLDEPMAALDAGARRKVRKFLSVRLRAIGIPCVVVSHDVLDVEMLGGRVAVIEKGQLVQVGTLDEIRRAPATEFVEQFLSREPEERAAAVAELGVGG
jgi:molybdate transport system ATP-binding protein